VLTAKRVERTRKPGRYSCGLVKGLKLQISERGAKSWVLKFQIDGRERMMGLGSAADFTLKEARERARAARQLLADGVDPLIIKREKKRAAKLATSKALTFREAAIRYGTQHEVKWMNDSHRDQFLSSLKAYAFPVIGDQDVAAIDTLTILKVIEPIWTTKSVTADRVRNRIEAVLDWSVVRGHRPVGTNPAKWKNHLDQVLPAARKVRPVRHFAAMPYAELPEFVQELREREDSIAGRALEFLILCANRSNEVLGAKWDEIDFETATWTVPASRMKAKREHRVPLSPQAIKLLRDLPVEDGNDFIFVGSTAGAGLSYMAFSRVMQRMERGETTHGFRSSFRVWAAEQTNYSREVAEQALAHAIGDQTEEPMRVRACSTNAAN
jgi:integrase